MISNIYHTYLTHISHMYHPCYKSNYKKKNIFCKKIQGNSILFNMGNNLSHTSMLGDRIESAIRFNKEKVTFQEGGLHDELVKLRPHFKELGYGIFWEEKRIPSGVSLTSNSYSLENNPYVQPVQPLMNNHKISEGSMRETWTTETIVEIKPIDKLEKFPTMNWDCILRKQNC